MGRRLRIGYGSVFPLSASSNHRYLVQRNGTPWASLGRTSWNVIALPESAWQAYLQDTLAKGFNTIELSVPHRDPRADASPFAGNGAAPFTHKLNGGAYSGSFSYANINNDAPDFSTPNPTYWGFVDRLVDYCAVHSIALHLFPAYVGFHGTNQGWMAEMVANGATRMQAYGAFVASRYRNYANIIWMLGGDKGTGTHPFNSNELAAETGLIDGLTGVSGQESLHYSAEWDGPSIGTDSAEFGDLITFNPVYSFQGQMGTYARQAYSHSPTIPAFMDEGPYDEEGPDGLNINGSATQPVRRFNWWGWLNAIGGYCTGNGYVWRFNSGYTSHLDTQGANDCAVMNAFIRSIGWQNLVPDGLGGIGTLITAGKGSIDTSSYVAAAATPAGDLLVAYLSPDAGNPTVAMSKLRDTVTARWFNPTTGQYTSIGSFANSGTHQFTKPGDNGTGDEDWVLRLDA